MTERKDKILDGMMEELFEENEIELTPEDDEEIPEEEEEIEVEETSEESESEEDEEINLDDEEIYVEEDEEETPIFKKRKHTPEEKQKYAFEKLRKEAKEKEDKLKELDEIAIRYGFTSHNEMLEQLRKESLEKEAKKQGVPAEVLAKIQKQEKELQEIKRAREEEIKKVKINNFLNSLDTFSKEYKLAEKDREQLLVALEDDGYTLDSLLSVKNPTRLFKGYMEDKITEKVKQEQLAREEKKRKMAEKKMKETTPPAEERDIEAFLDKLVKDALSKKY